MLITRFGVQVSYIPCVDWRDNLNPAIFKEDEMNALIEQENCSREEAERMFYSIYPHLRLTDESLFDETPVRVQGF